LNNNILNKNIKVQVIKNLILDMPKFTLIMIWNSIYWIQMLKYLTYYIYFVQSCVERNKKIIFRPNSIISNYLKKYWINNLQLMHKYWVTNKDWEF